MTIVHGILMQGLVTNITAMQLRSHKGSIRYGYRTPAVAFRVYGSPWCIYFALGINKIAYSQLLAQIVIADGFRFFLSCGLWQLPCARWS